MAVLVLQGDARHLPLPDASVDLIVTSPPYFGLRLYTDAGEHYGGQIGSEATPGEWVAALVACTREWMRVLKPSGLMFVNLGDKYAGAQNQRSRHHTRPLEGGRGHLDGWDQTVPQDVRPGARDKSLLGLPWRYALAATDQLGLILRRDIVWAKPNGLPESVTDRCRTSHEYLFHLVKQPRYYAAVDEIREAYGPNTHTGRRDGLPSPATRAVQRARPMGAGFPQLGGDLAAQQPNPLGKLPGSVWSIPSQPLQVPAHLGVDHFAAFPMELPRRCVLGWSPPGICQACGEGRRPSVAKHLTIRNRNIAPIRHANGTDPLSERPADYYATVPFQGSTEATITGYACACPTPDAPTRPSVVLDPFGGTGTTALVAHMHGRTGITIDRSADYTRLAHWRTHDPAERAKAMQVPKPPPIAPDQDALF